jgi:hypothetical protein
MELKARLKGYLEIEDCNFIGMDWSEMASGQTLPYPADYPYISQVQVPKAGQNVGYTYHLVKLINFKNITKNGVQQPFKRGVILKGHTSRRKK